MSRAIRIAISVPAAECGRQNRATAAHSSIRSLEWGSSMGRNEASRSEELGAGCSADTVSPYSLRVQGFGLVGTAALGVKREALAELKDLGADLFERGQILALFQT